MLLRAALAAAAAGLASAHTATRDDAAAAPPNVVFILSESLDGRLLRPGSPARIPNIRKLLVGGSVRFDAAYSNSPVCAPSRSSLWSGRAPHKIPHEHNGILVPGVFSNYEGLPANYSTRIDQLLAAQAGYSTQLEGKTDFTVGAHSESSMLEGLTFAVRWPYNITSSGGWVNEDPTPAGSMCASDGPVAPGGTGGKAGSLYAGDWDAVERTAAFAASAAEPFFAYVGTNILHPPYGTNEHWFNVTEGADVGLPHWAPLQELHPCELQASMRRGCTPPAGPNATAFYDPARITRVRRVYLAELEEFDAMVGRIVDGLQADPDRWARTLVVLAADHGDMQLEHQAFYKMLPYDPSARIPLAFAGPQLAGLGEAVIAQPAQLLDIFPTLLQLAGLAVPGYADGYSLVPFLRGAAADPTRPRFVASQNSDTDIAMAWFAVTDGDVKWVVYGTGAEGTPPQLFNLTADPGELANLWNSSDAARALAAQLDAQLRAQIDYPTVAMQIAEYQQAMFRWWTVNGTGGADWRTAIQDPSLRWHDSFARHPAEALAAVEAYLDNETIAIQPCVGALATAS